MNIVLFRKRRLLEVWDVSYDQKTGVLKAYTNAERAEVGILYLGAKVGANADVVVDPWRGDPYLVWPLSWIYYFEKEYECTIEDGWINVYVKPFYGGFLSRKYKKI